MIPFNDLSRSNNRILKSIEKELYNIVDNSSFILGSEVCKFEEEFSHFSQSKYTIGVANGTDAIELILRSLDIGKGDEVIVQVNTFIATAIAISRTGAKPVFIDNDDQYLIEIEQIEKAITKNTKAIISVNLYGQMQNNLEISKIAKKHNIYFIEDSAQSHGALENNNPPGKYSIAATYSFYPGKNLGAWGDAGAITTNNKYLYNKIIEIRNYGSNKKYIHNTIGFNSRLDTIQAIVLRKKLKFLKELNEKRNEIAQYYINNIDPVYELPKVNKLNFHVWHLFVLKVNNRKKLFEVAENKIQFQIHYPVPINFQNAYKDHPQFKYKFSKSYNNMNKIFTVPLFPEMSKSEVLKVTNFLNKYSEQYM